MKKLTHRTDEAYLSDIHDLCHEIMSDVDGLMLPAFLDDKRRLIRKSVTLNLQLIGEAASRITEATKLRHPRVPWADMIDLRNRLIHEYFEPNHLLMWNTITSLVPQVLQGFNPTPKRSQSKR